MILIKPADIKLLCSQITSSEYLHLALWEKGLLFKVAHKKLNLLIFSSLYSQTNLQQNSLAGNIS